MPKLSRAKQKAKVQIRDNLEAVNNKIISSLSSKKDYYPVKIAIDANFDEILKSDLENFHNYNRSKQVKILKLYLKSRDKALALAIKVIK